MSYRIIDNFLLSDTWRATSRNFIYGGDCATLFDANQYSSLYKLWEEKRDGRLSRGKPNRAQECGNLFEPLVAREFAEALGVDLLDTTGSLFEDLDFPIATTIDRIIASGPNVGWSVSIKTAYGEQAYEWSRAVPAYAQFQAQHEMAILGTPGQFFAAWVFKSGNPPMLRVHPMARDEDVVDKIRRRSVKLIQMVQDGTPPPVDGSAPTTKALARRYRNPVDEEFDLDVDMLDVRDRRLKLQAQAAAIDEQLGECDNRIRNALGNRTTGRLPDGFRVYWRANKNGQRTLRYERPKKQPTELSNGGH